MAIMKSFTFDGYKSSDYGIFISGDGVYNAPERDIEMVSIPGRNGALALDQGRFENIELTYPAGVFGTSQSDFSSKLSTFRNILCSRVSYVRLTDEYHPDEFRLALYRSGLEVEPVNYSNAGEFEIIFECKPQRFLTSGETTTTFNGNGSITNPTQFESKPLLVVTGTGTLTVNGTSITFSSSPTTVDCETMEAYNGSTSRNGSITLGSGVFPVLSPGSNSISKTSGISQIKITPRWWRI